jgi:hypothetical protein
VGSPPQLEALSRAHGRRQARGPSPRSRRGTGDIALRLAERAGPNGHVVIADINTAKLREAERRLAGHRLADRISLKEADAVEAVLTDGLEAAQQRFHTAN